MSKRIVIVGSGFGGLASAALLAKDGYEVTVVEKNDQLGGRARCLKKKGFSFDMGPSWYLMPDVFEKFFEEFDIDPEKHLSLQRLDPNYRVFFSEDDYIDVPADIESVRKLFDDLEPGGAKKFDTYLKRAEKHYRIAIDHLLYRPYNSWKDVLQWELAKNASGINVFSNMDSYVKTLFTNKKAQQILMYTLVFLGGAPKVTPAFYDLMSHVDFNLGVWYPKGGMQSVATAIGEIAKDQGVEFILNAPVTKIDRKDNKTIVQTKQKEIEADIVVVNADYHFAEMNLLDEQYRSYDQKYWEKKIMAPSAFMVYLGVNKKIKNLDHHNLFFDNDWEVHFDEVFSDPGWPKKPSYYVCCPSKLDDSVAPKGKENLFVLVPVASGIEDTPEIRDRELKKVIKHLEGLTNENIADHIEYQQVYTLNDFKEDYNSYKGTALGLAHTLLQTANFRPHQKSKKLDNVYYVGQYTHPGIGVPIALISAEVARQLINKEHGNL